MSLILIVSLTLHIGSHSVSAEPDITYLQEPLSPVTPVFPPVNTNTVVANHADHHPFTMRISEDMVAPRELDNNTQERSFVIDVEGIHSLSLWSISILCII